MAGEVQAAFASGRQLYFLVRNSTGSIWNGSSFEVYNTSHFANYVNAMSEQGSAGAYYTGNFPSTILAGVYSLVVKQQIGGSAAESDPFVAVGDFQWNGVNPLPLSDLATSGYLGAFLPIKLYRGAAVPAFPFKMVSNTDHFTPFTSGVVSGQIAKDGGAFGALQSGIIAEMGRGWYSVSLTSGDMLANSVALSFSANGISGGSADQRDMAILLQRVSGSI